LANLRSGHLVVCVDTDYAFAKALRARRFSSSPFASPGTKEQDGFCVAKVRDHLAIASVEVRRELSVSPVVC
jgi:hypothetical protein